MIKINSAADIENARKAASIVARVLKKLTESVKPGITTGELDELAKKTVREYGAKPAFLNYRGFPASACVSINEEVVHGIPSKKRMVADGDIVSIDFGAYFAGFFGDSAVTVAAGKVSQKAADLIRATREALYKGIEKAVAGNRLGDISDAIQSHAEKAGFSVVRDFVGHGIGRELHMEPLIPNYRDYAGNDTRLKEGMIFAIEPMINEKGFEVKVLDDGWTVVTRDKGLSAHFEHTIAVTSGKPIILSEII